MKKKPTETLMAAILSLCAVLTVTGCSSSRKLSALKSKGTTASLSLPRENPPRSINASMPKRDTLMVKDPDGKDVLIMKAMRNENGEMIATDIIDAAVVTARFRNVAERSGKVDICFDVTVPRSMQDSRWQLRLRPNLHIFDETLPLDQVVVTGKDFRKTQLRGYQQYQRFLDKIITDTTLLVDRHQLEVFIQRNLPEVYRFKRDSSYVSDEQFASVFGVTENMAVKHYTLGYLVRSNARRIARKEKMFKKYVKTPLDSEGLKLDTVLTNADNDLVYRYVQTITARPKLKKVGVDLGGVIFEQDKKIYDIPRGEMLTFYISSLSSFLDNSEKYMTQIVERRAAESSSCLLDFDKGKWDVNPSMGRNSREISKIKGNLSSLMANEKFDLDSIVVTATCSPEGGFALNDRLSRMRGESVSRYFDSFMRQWRDSISRQEAMTVNLTGESIPANRPERIRFTSKAKAQNWEGLDALVEADTILTQAQKENYRQIRSQKDPDARENLLSGTPYYRHLRDDLYPHLRTVSFDFHLHRKGMVKDTIHTTVVDTTYKRGLEALREMDYEKAVEILRPYADFNTAVAYCATSRDASAMDILSRMKPDDRVDYLMAILYSRKGDEKSAVEHYMKACRENPSYVNRGNLDPEISSLIRKYGLNEDN